MKNIYKTIKQTARKYALPAIVAGSLALGSCSDNTSYLQVNPEVQKELYRKDSINSAIQHLKNVRDLEALTSEADSYAVTARDLFEAGVAKQKLDSTTMTDTYKNYMEADFLYRKINRKAIEKSVSEYENVGFSNDDNELYKMHEKTLHYWDFGKSEIELDLKKKGASVDVYNPTTNPEKGIPALITIGFILGTAVLGNFVSFNRAKRLGEAWY